MAERLFLIRHFETDAPVKGAFYGNTDLPILPRGELQFEGLLSSFQERAPATVFCSPKLRCRQTAGIYFPEAKIEFLDLAKETNFGDWEGLTFKQISEEAPDLVDAWQDDPSFCFPSGESIRAFTQRVQELKKMLCDNKSKDVFLVAHAGVIRFLICLLLEIGIKKSLIFKVDPGSMTVVDVFDNGLGVLSGLNLKGDYKWPE